MRNFGEPTCSKVASKERPGIDAAETTSPAIGGYHHDRQIGATLFDFAEQFRSSSSLIANALRIGFASQRLHACRLGRSNQRAGAGEGVPHHSARNRRAHAWPRARSSRCREPRHRPAPSRPGARVTPCGGARRRSAFASVAIPFLGPSKIPGGKFGKPQERWVFGRPVGNYFWTEQQNMIVQKRGFLPVTGFVAGIGLAFSAYAQTAVNLFRRGTTRIRQDLVRARRASYRGFD